MDELTYAWQFKNGSLGRITARELFQWPVDFYHAYDYSRGEIICYEK